MSTKSLWWVTVVSRVTPSHIHRYARLFCTFLILPSTLYTVCSLRPVLLCGKVKSIGFNYRLVWYALFHNVRFTREAQQCSRTRTHVDSDFARTRGLVDSALLQPCQLDSRLLCPTEHLLSPIHTVVCAFTRLSMPANRTHSTSSKQHFAND